MANKKDAVEANEETKSKVLIANQTVQWSAKAGEPVMVFKRDEEVKGLPDAVAKKMVKANLMRKDYLD